MRSTAGAVGGVRLTGNHGDGGRAVDQQEELPGHFLGLGKAASRGQLGQVGHQALFMQQRYGADLTFQITDLTRRVDKGAAMEVRCGEPAAQQWEHGQ